MIDPPIDCMEIELPIQRIVGGAHIDRRRLLRPKRRFPVHEVAARLALIRLQRFMRKGQWQPLGSMELSVDYASDDNFIRGDCDVYCTVRAVQYFEPLGYLPDTRAATLVVVLP